MGCQIAREFTPLKGYASGLSIEKDETFQQMVRLAELKTHGIRYLFIYDVSRFGRIPPKSKFYWEEHLKRSGVQVVYAAEHFQNDGSLGDEIHQFVSHSEAHQYSMRLRTSTMRGCRSHANLGRSCGGRAPFGYARLLLDQQGNPVKVLKDGEHKADKLQHVVWTPGAPEEVELVRHMFEAYAKGNSLNFIVDEFNRQGTPSHWGGKWNKTSVRSIIKNPVYTGVRIYFKHNYHDRSPNPRVSVRPKEEWIVKESAHPPLVSKELFDKAQARFPTKTRRDARTYSSQHLLTGVVNCTHCNSRYCGQFKHHEGKKVPYYVCGAYHAKGKHVCPSFSIPASILEGFALKQIQEKVSKIRFSDKVRGTLAGMLEGLTDVENRTRVDNLAKSIGDKKKEIHNIVEAIKVSGGSPALLTELERLEKHKNQLEVQHDSLKMELSGVVLDVNSSINEMMGYLEDTPKIMARGTMAEKKSVIRSLIHHVEIRAKDLQARFYFYKLPYLQSKIADTLMVTGDPATFQTDGCGGWI